MHYVPWVTNEECWVIDVMKFYYDIHGHPSPDFRTFDPVIHYFMPQSEECIRSKGVFSSYFMGRGMREFIANQPPTWHLVEFPDAKPLADADQPDKRDQAIREAFTDDKDKFGEYLVLQITEGGAYVLELGSMKTIPLLDCSSKSFATALEYNKIKRGDILRGIEPIYVPDLLACDRYCFPNDALVKATMDRGTVHQLIVDHELGTSPVQKMLRLKYGTKWTAVKSAINVSLTTFSTSLVLAPKPSPPKANHCSSSSTGPTTPLPLSSTRARYTPSTPYGLKTITKRQLLALCTTSKTASLVC